MGYNLQNWCIDQHRKTNHFYDSFLPYEFHLRMVNQVFEDFKYLLDDVFDYFTGKKIYPMNRDKHISLRNVCSIAVWGHDLIEDCRVSYNDVSNNLGQEVAEIIYAVTNEKGKNRSERANDKYYEGIRNVKGAVFVKLCDRIANVQYSKLTKSRMFEVYKKENPHFIQQLGYVESENHEYKDMFDYLNNLFNS
jgi:(p)ppGpp synthase/HD superfamily hydrolase